MGTAINVVGMEDIERPLPFTVDWKVALSKRNLSLFKSCELWYMFSLCFQPRVFNLAIKSHGPRVSTFFLQSTNYESIIVILSVTCIVPKYYIVFCMIVMFLTLSSKF